VFISFISDTLQAIGFVQLISLSALLALQSATSYFYSVPITYHAQPILNSKAISSPSVFGR
jgi:hypothetical protein